jgi:hypothetical protein
VERAGSEMFPSKEARRKRGIPAAMAASIRLVCSGILMWQLVEVFGEG